MKKYILIISLIVLGLVITGCNNRQNKTTEIIKYELKTSEYFESQYNKSNKYYIDSIYELNKFYALFSNELNINEEYLNDNIIFIQVRQVGSGSISMELEDVTLKNSTVNFIVDEEHPEIGTDDIACWYLVAIIPTEELQGINFNDWVKPSDVES